MSEWAHALAKALGGKIRRTRDGVLVQCPAHDDRTPSLHISEHTDERGRPRLLVHDFGHCRFEDILPHLRATGLWDPPYHERGRPDRPPSKPRTDDATWAGPARPIHPPSLATEIHGEPEGYWTFRNASRAIVAYEARYPGKHYRPWSWWRTEPLAPPRLTMRAPPPGAATPWQLDRIVARTSSPIIIVEGARTAEAAQALLPDWIATTWLGAGGATARTDWSALARRRVLLVPDADRQGAYAMRDVALVLARLSARLAWSPIKEWCPPRKHRTKGFDAYDARNEEGWCARTIHAVRTRLHPTHPLWIPTK